jgi:hypothetical protein
MRQGSRPCPVAGFGSGRMIPRVAKRRQPRPSNGPLRFGGRCCRQQQNRRYGADRDRGRWGYRSPCCSQQQHVPGHAIGAADPRRSSGLRCANPGIWRWHQHRSAERRNGGPMERRIGGAGNGDRPDGPRRQPANRYRRWVSRNARIASATCW